MIKSTLIRIRKINRQEVKPEDVVRAYYGELGTCLQFAIKCARNGSSSVRGVCHSVRIQPIYATFLKAITLLLS